MDRRDAFYPWEMDDEERSRFAAAIKRLSKLKHPRVQVKHLALAIWDVRAYDEMSLRWFFKHISPQPDAKVGYEEFQEIFRKMTQRHRDESRRRWWRKKYLQKELDELLHERGFIHDLACLIRYVRAPVFKTIELRHGESFHDAATLWIELLDTERNRWRCYERGKWFSEFNLWNLDEIKMTDALRRHWKRRWSVPTCALSRSR